jgi:hypothetical protein
MVKPDVPEDTTVDFSLEFVWKATSFDRMNTALKLFKDYSASISGYLFHVLLGHEVSLHCFFGHAARSQDVKQLNPHVISTWRVCVQMLDNHAAYAQLFLTAHEQELHAGWPHR